MSDLQNHYGKAQSETAALLGYDLAHLTPDQSLRLDCAVALRLALDDLQGRVIRGESIDVAKMLTASEALSRLLPAAVLAAPPSERREDSRQYMLRTYLEARRRGELVDQQREPTLRAQISQLQAENESLRAALGAGSRASAAAITPPTCDIVPPGERAECDPGMRPGPDDPPRRRPVTIEGKPAPAAPAPNMVDLRAGYSDGPAEPWRDFCTDVDGVPLSTRGKYWGPV
jgi:hypothetical protein